MGYNPNIPHLEVGLIPVTNHLLNSWDIQAYLEDLYTLIIYNSGEIIATSQNLGPQKVANWKIRMGPPAKFQQNLGG